MSRQSFELKIVNVRCIDETEHEGVGPIQGEGIANDAMRLKAVFLSEDSDGNMNEIRTKMFDLGSNYQDGTNVPMNLSLGRIYVSESQTFPVGVSVALFLIEEDYLGDITNIEGAINGYAEAAKVVHGVLSTILGSIDSPITKIASTIGAIASVVDPLIGELILSAGNDLFPPKDAALLVPYFNASISARDQRGTIKFEGHGGTYELTYEWQIELHRGGIGGYDLLDNLDQLIAFDYSGSGKNDHLLAYRPGAGIVYILAKDAGTFRQVFNGGRVGIGSYDVGHQLDQIIAFDYRSSGKLDHLLAYRPGAGIVHILANVAGTFRQVFNGGRVGIGSYDVGHQLDQIIAFDYRSSGKLDHLVAYRPGAGIVHILANDAGTFRQVFNGGRVGIGSYDVGHKNDRIIAFDYESSGKLDHLLAYRPGAGFVHILAHSGGRFTPVYRGVGIGGYDMLSERDRIIAFDYNGTGKLDHLLVYRPGDGIVYILSNERGTFRQVFNGGRVGIGTYDVGHELDRIMAFDYNGTGRADHLLAYRPGAGFVHILTKDAGRFRQVFGGDPLPSRPIPAVPAGFTPISK